ncbi:MAG: hypothetical protein J6A74_03170 [Oscillospiraceae bacterium]|nr:hypothetical protein [Oscillospiraceae bacterium]
MVKGISRQVIVVESPDKKLFEQAIFILREDALSGEGITDAQLLREAKRLIESPKKRRIAKWTGVAVWAMSGAFATGLVWLLTTVF